MYLSAKNIKTPESQVNYLIRKTREKCDFSFLYILVISTLVTKLSARRYFRELKVALSYSSCLFRRERFTYSRIAVLPHRRIGRVLVKIQFRRIWTSVVRSCWISSAPAKLCLLACVRGPDGIRHKPAFLARAPRKTFSRILFSTFQHLRALFFSFSLFSFFLYVSLPFVGVFPRRQDLRNITTACHVRFQHEAQAKADVTLVKSRSLLTVVKMTLG